MVSKNDLPRAPIRRMFKRAGGERLSPDAQSVILENVENYAMSLIEDSIAVSKHTGRKTVLPEDVKLVLKIA